jgi:hypothetical protein
VNLRLKSWSTKIFKSEQTITGIAVDENKNTYVLGKTAVTNIGSSAWVTKYGESKNNSPEFNFDEAPAIWHKSKAQGVPQNGFNFFPNDII